MTIEIAYDQIPQGPASGKRFRVLAALIEAFANNQLLDCKNFAI